MKHTSYIFLVMGNTIREKAATCTKIYSYTTNWWRITWFSQIEKSCTQLLRRESCLRGAVASSPTCCLITSWFGPSSTELVEGLSPAGMIFLNQDTWSRGEFLLELWLSGDRCELDAIPARKRYATLLAVTISVLTCLNCGNIASGIGHHDIEQNTKSLMIPGLNEKGHRRSSMKYRTRRWNRTNIDDSLSINHIMESTKL